MNENSNIIRLRQPDEIDDPLTNVLRSGARQLLAQAVELEAEVFLAAMKDLKLADGRDRLVRHGHGPERTIQTEIGPVEVARVQEDARGKLDVGFEDAGEQQLKNIARTARPSSRQFATANVVHSLANLGWLAVRSARMPPWSTLSFASLM